MAGRPTWVEFVDPTALRPVVARPRFGVYIRELWRRRHFIALDARARVASSTKGTFLGSVWLVLRPMLDALAYFVVFGLLLRADRGIENFLGYLILGVFLFQYTSGALNAGASSLIAGRALLRSFTFPRAALPLATVARETLRFGPVLVAMLALIALIPPTEAFTWRVVLLAPVLVLQVAMTTGLVLIAARVVSRVPDVQQLIGLGTRFWLYGSAVFFSFDRLIDNPTLLTVVHANPMFRVLDMARDVVLYGQTPEVDSWLILSGWTVGLLTFGFWFFWRAEERYARG